MSMESIKNSGTKNPEIRAYEIAHQKVAQKLAEEGFVLLKNDNHFLPLKKGSSLALFGAGATQTVKGGTGSGNVFCRHIVSVYEGLTAAGFEITNKDWIDSFEKIYEESREIWKRKVWEKADSITNPSLEGPMFNAYLSTPYDIPAGDIPTESHGDTAIFVLSRKAGEGADRRLTGGDYYISDEEYELLKAICSLYENVVLIINTGGAIDTNFADEFSQIKSILYITQPGQEGGHAVARVLSGDVSPSGKMTATWPIKYEDIPFAMEYSNLNGDLEKDYYKQGIFVGYRYFDTFKVPVKYGFGFGLSYTDFEITTESIQYANEEVTVNVNVKNIGDTFAGKEVVQIYMACPKGNVPKEFRRLVAFEKTKELASQEDQLLSIKFSVRDFTYYDEATMAWTLDKGIYGVFVGNSLDGSVLSGSLKIDETIICEQALASFIPKPEIEEITPPDSYIADFAKEPMVEIPADSIEKKVIQYGRYEKAPDDANMEIVKKLSVEQLIKLCTGELAGAAQSGEIGNAGITVPGSAAQTSACAIADGIPQAVLADGPAGVRLTREYETINGVPIVRTLEESIEGGVLNRHELQHGDETWYQYCTAFPVGTLIAQTWNKEAMVEFGNAIGEEMTEFGITFWLAPGMNIHRNPLCGRNFEYYSEDPLLAGICAGYTTLGVQKNDGRGTTIKHFACNSQENNRMGVDAIVSERAFREIYVKGFEKAIKLAQPKAIMTSYNKINGVHAANNYVLCTKLARDEWDFKGVIMTDWTTTNQGPDCTAMGCVLTGNDLIMPGKPMDHENLKTFIDQGILPLDKVQRSVWRLLNAIK